MSDTPRSDILNEDYGSPSVNECMDLCRTLERELNVERVQSQRLREAFEPLVAALNEEFTGENTLDFDDDISVAGGIDGESPITFGMIRKAEAALTTTLESHTGEPLSKTEQLVEQSSDPCQLEDVKRKWQSDKKWLHAAIHACFKHGVPLGSSALCEAVDEFKKVYIPREDVLPLVNTLHSIEIGGCNCHTKTPELVWHKDWCRYKQARQARETFTAKYVEVKG